MRRVFYVDTEKCRVTETSCEEYGHPNRDAQDREMYVNTHFISEKAAWECLLRNSKAGWELAVGELQRLKKVLQRAKEQVCDFSHRYYQVQEMIRIMEETKQEEEDAKTV